MFKKFLLFISCLTLLAPAVALADDVGAGHYGLDATLKAVNSDKEILPTTVAGGDDIPSIVGTVVALALSLIGIVFFLLALYAGFIWMTAMGNTEQVTKAKDILEAAAIGLVIVAGAYAITNFVFTNVVGQATVAPGAVDEAGGGAGDGVPVGIGLCDSKQVNDECGPKASCMVAGKNLMCVGLCEQKGGTCGDPKTCVLPNKTEPKLCTGGDDNVCCI